MLSNQPKYLKRLLVSLGILLVLLFGLNWWVKHKAVKLIETALPKYITLQYTDLDISTLGRSVALKNVAIAVKDSITQQPIGEMTIEDLQVKHFGVLDYLFNETLNLGYVGISNVKGYLNLPDSVAADTTRFEKKLPIAKATINTFDLKQLWFELKNPKTNAVAISLANLNLTVNSIEADLNKAKRSLSYGDYTIATDSIFAVLGPLNTLKIGFVEGTNKQTVIASAHLQTIYAPHELNKHISHEKDYFDVSIPKITAIEIPQSITFDGSPVTIEGISIEQPNAFIYRDKLVADDLSIKPMLSEQLRNIPIPYHIKQFDIKAAQLTYKERVHDYNDGGSLIIDHSDISIKDLSNLAQYQPIAIAIQAKFGGTGLMKAHWEFDVLNENDDFVFTADASNLNLTNINDYSRPNFNAEMEGHINQLYATITGDKHRSYIGIKSNHADIKIAVLNKTHHSRNKFVSSVANLMISKNSKTHKSNFTEVSAELERDRTKSVFNYLVKNVQKGMTKIFL